MIDYLLSESAFIKKLRAEGAEALRSEIKGYIERLIKRKNEIDDEAFSYAEQVENLKKELEIAKRGVEVENQH